MNGDDKNLGRFKHHIANINKELEKLLNSRVALIENIGSYALLGKGKRLRPLFFVLSCQLCNYRGEDIYRLSTIFEAVHTASLLHDDVLDNAEVRRNKPSANQVWGNQAAVLEGDFLASKSSSLAVGSNNLPFVKRLLDNGVQMAEGQIMELVHTHDWNTSKEQYMEIITAKTAVLISTACVCGAIISGSGTATEQALEEFGLNAGIAFQLMDDLMDYTSSQEEFGKPVGKDLREGKITLPLIYTLKKLKKSEIERLEDLFKNHRAAEADYKNLIELVRNNGSIEKIRDEAQSYVERAESCLTPFPDSSGKRGLLELNQYITQRNY
jgi:octaprenyl-diphosphate synthase